MAFQLTKIVTDLSSLGFSEKEIALYLVLKRMGTASLSEIADNIRFKPSQAMQVLKSLSKKGLVSQTKMNNKRLFFSEDPKKISSIVNEKQWNIEQMKSQVEPFVSSLDELFPGGSNVQNDTDILFTEGKESILKVCQKFWAQKEVFSFFDPERLKKNFPSLFKEKIKSTTKLHQSLQELIAASPSASHYLSSISSPKYQYLLCPKKTILSVDFFISSESILFLSLHKTPNVIQIKNFRIAESSRLLFHLYWNHCNNQST